MNKKYRIDLETDGGGQIISAQVHEVVDGGRVGDFHTYGSVTEVLDLIKDEILSQEDKERIELAPQMLIDWSKHAGWRVKCSEHGWLRIPPQNVEEDEHDLAVLAGWEHLVDTHGERHFAGPYDLINPDRWADAITRIRSL